MRQTGIVGFPMLWVGAMGFPLSIKQTCLVFEVYQMNCVPMPCVWTLEKVVKVVLKHCTKGGWGGEWRGRKKTAKSSRHSKAFLPMIGAFRQIHAPHPFQKNRCAYHWGEPPPCSPFYSRLFVPLWTRHLALYRRRQPADEGCASNYGRRMFWSERVCGLTFDRVASVALT